MQHHHGTAVRLDNIDVHRYNRHVRHPSFDEMDPLHHGMKEWEREARLIRQAREQESKKKNKALFFKGLFNKRRDGLPRVIIIEKEGGGDNSTEATMSTGLTHNSDGCEEPNKRPAGARMRRRSLSPIRRSPAAFWEEEQGGGGEEGRVHPSTSYAGWRDEHNIVRLRGDPMERPGIETHHQHQRTASFHDDFPASGTYFPQAGPPPEHAQQFQPPPVANTHNNYMHGMLRHDPRQHETPQKTHPPSHYGLVDPSNYHHSHVGHGRPGAPPQHLQHPGFYQHGGGGQVYLQQQPSTPHSFHYPGQPYAEPYPMGASAPSQYVLGDPRFEHPRSAHEFSASEHTFEDDDVSALSEMDSSLEAQMDDYEDDMSLEDVKVPDRLTRREMTPERQNPSVRPSDPRRDAQAKTLHSGGDAARTSRVSSKEESMTNMRATSRGRPARGIGRRSSERRIKDHHRVQANHSSTNPENKSSPQRRTQRGATDAPAKSSRPAVGLDRNDHGTYSQKQMKTSEPERRSRNSRRASEKRDQSAAKNNDVQQDSAIPRDSGHSSLHATSDASFASFAEDEPASHLLTNQRAQEAGANQRVLRNERNEPSSRQRSNTNEDVTPTRNGRGADRSLNADACQPKPAMRFNNGSTDVESAAGNVNPTSEVEESVLADAQRIMDVYEARPRKPRPRRRSVTEGERQQRRRSPPRKQLETRSPQLEKVEGSDQRGVSVHSSNSGGHIHHHDVCVKRRTMERSRSQRTIMSEGGEPKDHEGGPHAGDKPSTKRTATTRRRSLTDPNLTRRAGRRRSGSAGVAVTTNSEHAEHGTISSGHIEKRSPQRKEAPSHRHVGKEEPGVDDMLPAELDNTRMDDTQSDRPSSVRQRKSSGLSDVDVNQLLRGCHKETRGHDTRMNGDDEYASYYDNPISVGRSSSRRSVSSTKRSPQRSNPGYGPSSSAPSHNGRELRRIRTYTNVQSATEPRQPRTQTTTRSAAAPNRNYSSELRLTTRKEKDNYLNDLFQVNGHASRSYTQGAVKASASSSHRENLKQWL